MEADKKSLDRSGVDFCIGYPDEVNDALRYPTIEAQVKSWRVPSPLNGPDWHYELSEKHFNALAGTGFVVPRFLFLLIVPRDVRDYAAADPHCLKLSHAGYWVSLMNRTRIASPSSQATVTVDVPKMNLLTVNALLGLIDPVLVRVP